MLAAKTGYKHNTANPSIGALAITISQNSCELAYMIEQSSGDRPTNSGFCFVM